ncbi:hypothetical protein HD806DRAFT_544357 [Xylariaceae sp. AK1471]|nr:hypothetical protein HD806DRAFT_544357 [Xylariaceae sp. AK1471]
MYTSPFSMNYPHGQNAGPPPASQAQGVAQNQAGNETDLFTLGESWAVCFFEGQDPLAQEFRAPKSGVLANQSFAVYVPYRHLRQFASNDPRGTVGWHTYLTDAAGHCRLRAFRCDRWGAPQQWPIILHAPWDGNYQEGHFKFNAKLQLSNVFEKGRYYIVCEFYKGQFQFDNPDARYTTGIFEVL